MFSALSPDSQDWSFFAGRHDCMRVRPAKDHLRQMSSSHLFGTPLQASLFFLVFLGMLCLPLRSIAGDAVVLRVANSSFQVAHEGLVEAIESEGLVVGSILPFRAMLARTSADKDAIPYGEAEIIQFCSSVLASELVHEDPAQLTLCPLSITLYTLVGDVSSNVWMAYRSPGDSSVGRRHAESLLQRIVRRASGLAQLR